MHLSIRLLTMLWALTLFAPEAYALSPLPPHSHDVGHDQHCTVSSPNDGGYSVGRLSGSLLKANANTPLAPINKVWHISCDAETYLTFSTVDNRASSASTPGLGHYGLGQVNGSGKIGFYRVTMKNATVDGDPTRLFSTNSTAFNVVSSLTLTTTHRAIGWANANNVQKSGRVFTAELEVLPTLASVAQMNGPITDRTLIDGSMSLNFAFGI